MGKELIVEVFSVFFSSEKIYDNTENVFYFTFEPC